MKIIPHIQVKKLIGFKPELHWKMIISCAVGLIIIASGYALYLYTFAKKQSEKTYADIYVSSGESSSTSVHNMEELFSVYDTRGEVYKKSMQILTKNLTILATSTAGTTTVATSSKQ